MAILPVIVITSVSVDVKIKRKPVLSGFLPQFIRINNHFVKYNSNDVNHPLVIAVSTSTVKTGWRSIRGGIAHESRLI